MINRPAVLIVIDLRQNNFIYSYSDLSFVRYFVFSFKLKLSNVVETLKLKKPTYI